MTPSPGARNTHFSDADASISQVQIDTICTLIGEHSSDDVRRGGSFDGFRDPGPWKLSL